MKKQTVCTLTFIPTSIGERCENGTSLVVNSQSKIEKLHISDARMFISSAFLCRAKNRQYIITFRDQPYMWRQLMLISVATQRLTALIVLLDNNRATLSMITTAFSKIIIIENGVY